MLQRKPIQTKSFHNRQQHMRLLKKVRKKCFHIYSMGKYRPQATRDSLHDCKLWPQRSGHKTYLKKIDQKINGQFERNSPQICKFTTALLHAVSSCQISCRAQQFNNIESSCLWQPSFIWHARRWRYLAALSSYRHQIAPPCQHIETKELKVITGSGGDVLYQALTRRPTWAFWPHEKPCGIYF